MRVILSGYRTSASKDPHCYLLRSCGALGMCGTIATCGTCGTCGRHADIVRLVKKRIAVLTNFTLVHAEVKLLREYRYQLVKSSAFLGSCIARYGIIDFTSKETANKLGNGFYVLVEYRYALV